MRKKDYETLKVMIERHGADFLAGYFGVYLGKAIQDLHKLSDEQSAELATNVMRKIQSN